ncbi:DUF3438 family protein [Cysteiniphilum halobium]|uniref:DUF3438 family protein n=1 Tax=Cysteiniphilum halobium TaxID=2219059 RepID=UPI0013C32EAC|nr:DUF3438 family protein [Cysteiniphilum halobium]
MTLIVAISGLVKIAFADDFSNSSNCQVIQWSDMPITLNLPVNNQVVIHFNHPLYTEHVKTTLTSDEVDLVNNGGSLYVTAKKAFQPTLYPVNLTDTKTTVMLQFKGVETTTSTDSSSNNASLTPLTPLTPLCYTIVTHTQKAGENTGSANAPLMSNTNSIAAASELSTSFDGTNNQARQIIPSPISLTRFAIQQLGNPRLRERVSNIYRTPMQSQKIIDLYPITTIESLPKVQWQSGNLYVTTVLLVNMSPIKQVLDPRLVHGYFLSASFYPTNVLSPLNSKGSSNQTWLIVVSNLPFHQAIHTFNPFARDAADAGGVQ